MPSALAALPLLLRSRIGHCALATALATGGAPPASALELQPPPPLIEQASETPRVATLVSANVNVVGLRATGEEGCSSVSPYDYCWEWVGDGSAAEDFSEVPGELLSVVAGETPSDIRMDLSSARSRAETRFGASRARAWAANSVEHTWSLRNPQTFEIVQEGYGWSFSSATAASVYNDPFTANGGGPVRFAFRLEREAADCTLIQGLYPCQGGLPTFTAPITGITGVAGTFDGEFLVALFDLDTLETYCTQGVWGGEGEEPEPICSDGPALASLGVWELPAGPGVVDVHVDAALLDGNRYSLVSSLRVEAESNAYVDFDGGATLERIHAGPGIALDFASGSAYPILVPEPAGWVLGLTAFASVAATARRRRVISH